MKSGKYLKADVRLELKIDLNYWSRSQHCSWVTFQGRGMGELEGWVGVGYIWIKLQQAREDKMRMGSGRLGRREDVRRYQIGSKRRTSIIKICKEVFLHFFFVNLMSTILHISFHSLYFRTPLKSSNVDQYQKVVNNPMQKHTPVYLKELRLLTDSGLPNRSLKRKTQNRSMSKKLKRKADIFNFDKFLQRLRLQTIKTERFTSPNKNPYDVYDRGLQSSKSKSRKHTRSIQTSRQRSGDTYRKPTHRPTTTNQSRSKPKHIVLKESAKLLRVQPGLEFRELATQMFNKFSEVETKVKQSEEPKEVYRLCVRYRELFGGLIKSMIEELNGLSEEKENEIISQVENITTLQNDVLQRQNMVEKLEEQNKSYKTALEVSKRIIRQQNAYIAEMKGKENKVSKLLYAMRKRGIDVDQIYIADVQTPMSDPSQALSQEGQSQHPDSPPSDSIPPPWHLNQSY